METLMVLTYAAICWIVFKVFKIKVNKWSLTTAVLGGVFLIGMVLMVMAYNHPASVQARSFFITTQIVPNVKGQVIDIAVKPNTPLKKGDVLFKIDPTVYQARYNVLKARLDFAKKRLDETTQLAKLAGGSQFEVEEFEKQVKDFTAQFAEAQFNLDSCTVRAPSNGFVTQIRVKPGQMAVPFPITPLMTFVNTDTMTFVAGFHQEPMQNLKKDLYADVIFPGIPGRIFKAKVVQVLPVMAEGELNPNQSLYTFTRGLPQGLIAVELDVKYDKEKYFIPAGSEAIAAVYGENFTHFAMVRMVLMRMKSWTYFLRFH